MAKIQVTMFIDVEVTEENGNVWEALNEATEIIKANLKNDKRIGNIYTEGISLTYKKEMSQRIKEHFLEMQEKVLKELKEKENQLLGH